MHTILISDDDLAVRTSLSLLFKQAGYKTILSDNPEETIRNISENREISLVVMDMNYSIETSGKEGLELVKNIRNINSSIPLILITAWGSISLAVEGIKLGADDFINKPWDNTHLLNSVKTFIDISEKKVVTHIKEQNISNSEKKDKKQIQELKSRREKLNEKYNFCNIIGHDSQILSILETITQISKTEASVLITGESGTGKELIAEAIHFNSNRTSQPFVKVNLGGISQSLFESEMFGHKKGAFTDASSDRIGRFEMANNGTIFLDEIGDLDINSQVKLLRVLQERKFEPLGSSITKSVNFRLVSATNKDIPEMVSNDKFREDLFYRINLIIIKLPALRERKGDIPLIINFFIDNLKKMYSRESLTVDSKAMKWLSDLPWPGNIRELKNLVERTVLVTNNDTLTVEDFSNQYLVSPAKKESKSMPAVGTMTIDDMEKNMIVKALEFYNNNISKVAKSLGLSRAALYRRLEKYEVNI